jgi:hypothetical protein
MFLLPGWVRTLGPDIDPDDVDEDEDEDRGDDEEDEDEDEDEDDGNGEKWYVGQAGGGLHAGRTGLTKAKRALDFRLGTPYTCRVF